ncbi:biotin-dependent carboxyltransferase family protein [Muriicola sp. Z0-33]|uniref:5-oxoprolinase subunit C family protein n=1 Tax=Muriicola sp. Z0-33 TaxID=2816957 RepID=UPI0022379F72|nr:biotin-dependent carboxyltransferase family protein [Muriicola sp. Z0-33]MCW5515397.1 biotin-dependent carboxyltransferase family protein [Muriicola sp. Z0-33]
MLKVVASGFFSTVQDIGRFNFRNKGVPVSGAMDSYSAAIANSLLENESSDAVLEITMTGPTLEFNEPTYIAITGAELSAELNGNGIKAYEVHQIRQGDILSFGKLINGFRCYLAIKNGFKTEEVLGSRSFYKPITKLNCIRDYMELNYDAVPAFTPKIAEVKAAPFHKVSGLEVQYGPEYGILSDKQLEILFSKEFSVAKENNRMAYQLNETIDGHSINMLTSATLPGTVQLTPAGKLIILMRDGQTTGGYPRILQLSKKAISILSQKKYGDQVAFEMS